MRRATGVGLILFGLGVLVGAILDGPYQVVSSEAGVTRMNKFTGTAWTRVLSSTRRAGGAREWQLILEPIR